MMNDIYWRALRLTRVGRVVVYLFVPLVILGLGILYAPPTVGWLCVGILAAILAGIVSPSGRREFRSEREQASSIVVAGDLSDTASLTAEYEQPLDAKTDRSTSFSVGRNGRRGARSFPIASVLRAFAFCMVAAVVGAATTIALHLSGMMGGGGSGDVSYSDFLSITLTALGLMITILGFFVAALGVIGWTTIEKKLQAHSLEYFAKQLEKDGPLRGELEELFTEIAYSGVASLRTQKQEEGQYTD